MTREEMDRAAHRLLRQEQECGTPITLPGPSMSLLPTSTFDPADTTRDDDDIDEFETETDDTDDDPEQV